MSNVENGRADLIQGIADAIMAEAREWGGTYSWFWRKSSLEEAEYVLDGELSAALADEVSRLSNEDREAVIAALVPLVAVEYENQQGLIEGTSVVSATEHSAAGLQKLLLDEDLTPPELYNFELALGIRELAENLELEILESLVSSAELGPKEQARYQDAVAVRRVLDAKRSVHATLENTVG